MKYYGTKNNKDYGFYKENFENAIEITDEYWCLLLNEQNLGKMIIPFNNSVIAVDEDEYSFENNVWEKLTDDEVQKKKTAKQNSAKKAELEAQLEELDKKRIRAVAEPSEKEDGISWLEYYNSIAENLRTELSKIS